MSIRCLLALLAVLLELSIARRQSPIVGIPCDGYLGPVGDIDLDFTTDFATRLGSSPLLAPVVAVRSGATGAVISTLSVPALASNATRPSSCVPLGDLDGDSFDDLILVSRNSPTIRLLSSASLQTLQTLSFNGLVSVMIGAKAVGDADGDGICDFVVMYNPGTAFGTIMSFRSGNTGALIRLVPIDPTAPFVTLVDRLEDFDGDGVDELLVVRPTTSSSSLQVTIESAATGAISMSIVIPIAWNYGFADESFACGCGDIDLDGREDFAMLYNPPGSTSPPSIRIHSSADGSVLSIINPPSWASVNLPYGIGRLGKSSMTLLHSIAVGLPADSGIYWGLCCATTNSAITGDVSIYPLGTIPTNMDGTIVDGAGIPTPRLGIDGRFGTSANVVRVVPGAAFPISIAATAPSVSAPFALFGCLGVPLPTDPTPTPAGFMPFPPSLLQPSDPRLFLVTSSFGPTASALIPSTPAPWSTMIPGVIPAGRAATFCAVMQTGSIPLTLGVTNAVILTIRP